MWQASTLLLTCIPVFPFNCLTVPPMKKIDSSLENGPTSTACDWEIEEQMSPILIAVLLRAVLRCLTLGSRLSPVKPHWKLPTHPSYEDLGSVIGEIPLPQWALCPLWGGAVVGTHSRDGHCALLLGLR